MTVHSMLRWSILFAVSLLVHALLSWQAGRGLDLPGVGGTDPQPEIELSLSAPADTDQQQLVFEAPIAFEVPAVILATSSHAAPPPDVDLAMTAAAGGDTESLLAVPLLADRPVTQGQGVAGFGAGVGTGLSNSSNRFAAYVQGLRETGLDVVFVVDATGSMDWAIAEVRTRIVDIVDSVRSLVPIARFGVVAYRDFDDPEFVTRVQTLTFSLAKLSRFLDGLEARGGGSLQEAVSAGLEAALTRTGWRTGVRRVVVLIGDAPPHQENYDRILSLTRELVATGGQVSTLDVSHDSNPALIEASLGRTVNRALYRAKPMLQFQTIADAGEGVAATMDGDIQVARQLISLIMGGQFAREMALLMEAG